MTTIYLVRHGQSKGNKHYQLTGQPISGAGELGTDLTDEGKEQIEGSLNKIKHIKFTAVYSSDMVRTHESAIIMASHFGVTVSTTPIIREHHIDEETPTEGAKRLKDFLMEVENKHTGENVLVVTHGALMRVFLISLGFAKDENELPGGSVENAGYVKLTIENNNFIVEETYKVTKQI